MVRDRTAGERVGRRPPEGFPSPLAQRASDSRGASPGALSWQRCGLDQPRTQAQCLMRRNRCPSQPPLPWMPLPQPGAWGLLPEALHAAGDLPVWAPGLGEDTTQPESHGARSANLLPSGTQAAHGGCRDRHLPTCELIPQPHSGGTSECHCLCARRPPEVAAAQSCSPGDADQLAAAGAGAKLCCWFRGGRSSVELVWCLRGAGVGLAGGIAARKAQPGRQAPGWAGPRRAGPS